MGRWMLSAWILVMAAGTAGAENTSLPSTWPTANVLATGARSFRIETPTAEAAAPFCLVTCDGVPIAVAQRSAVARAYEVTTEELLYQPPPLTAHLPPPDLIARLRDDWPAEADLCANVDAVGPGQRGVWLDMGRNGGAAAGDGWCLMVGGQAAARLRIQYVSDDAAYAEVLPLVSDLSLAPGQRVCAWPRPAEMRAGQATGSVSYVDASPRDAPVWVAVPPGVDLPAEPHFDFFRGTRYLGHGRGVRRDGVFWYATLIPADRRALIAATTQPETPDGAALSTAARVVRVGDRARIRTKKEVAERRFDARIFELTRSSGLINAGESESLATGMLGSLYRDGTQRGEVRVTRVQSDYAQVAPASPAETLQIGDTVRFAPGAAEVPRVVGDILGWQPDLLAWARVRETVPTDRPLVVLDGLRVVAVALPLVQRGDELTLLVLPASVRETLPVVGLTLGVAP